MPQAFSQPSFPVWQVVQTVEDSALVNEFVDAYQHTINTRDPAALAAFFTEDADFVMFNLPKVKGRQAIEDWWRSYFSKPRSYRALFIIDEIRIICDDVAQLNFTVTGAIPEPEGKLQPIRKTRAMWVLVRETGEWHIAALRVISSEDDRVIRRSGN